MPHPFDIIVYFEDVQPYSDIDLPLSFRANIEARSEREWRIDTYEMQSRQDGSWIRVSPYHHAHAMCDGFTRSDSGYAIVETAILNELPKQEERERFEAAGADRRAA